MIRALAEIHDLNLVHHDIKPDNMGLSVSEMEVKYLDFGMMAAEDRMILGGTPHYMHPLKLEYFGYDEDENWKKLKQIREELKKLNQTNVDIWALGLTIVTLLHPEILDKFNPKDLSSKAIAKSLTDMNEAISKKQFSIINDDEEFNQIVRSMVNFDQSKSLPTLKQLYESMDTIYQKHWKVVQRDRHKYFCLTNSETKPEQSRIKRELHRRVR